LTEDTLTLRLWDQGNQQAQENKAKRYGEHLLTRFRKKLAKRLQDITFQFKAKTCSLTLRSMVKETSSPV